MAKVSIIIPCRKVNSTTERCVSYCERLPEEKEIIVVPDDLVKGLPSTKRNYGMAVATGNIFAFIDSDAFPNYTWLKNALYWLRCFPAVCGPGVLPYTATLGERVADQVHKWIFCPYRVRRMTQRIVPWHPTFNLIVKRSVATPFEDYLTGEDEKFCLKIRGGIFYHPDILVFHDRRPAFKPLWKQFGTYARHKGAFQSMALLAWLTTLITYSVNFVIGFFRKRP